MNSEPKLDESSHNVAEKEDYFGAQAEMHPQLSSLVPQAM